MSTFDAKWLACAARARQAAARHDSAPLGFATRVLALGLEPVATAPESLWERLALRSLAGALALLALCMVLELPHLRDSRPLAPGLENAVAQLVWSL